MFDLTGKVAIVTGGGGGLGRPISVALAERGADVVVDHFDAGHLEATVDEIEALVAGAWLSRPTSPAPTR